MSRGIYALQWTCLICVLMFAVSGCNTTQSLNTLRLPTDASQIVGQVSKIVGQAGQSSGQTGGGHGLQLAGSHNFPAGRPADFKAFKERYETIGTSPAGAVRMYFDALYSYIDPARRAEGAKMLRYSLHEGPNWERSPAWATFVSRLKDPSWHYIFRSFAEGSSPENSYAMNPDNYRLMFAGSRQETDYVYVAIRSSGADSPRPLHAQRFEDGLWYVINNHGTYSDVRKPANQIRRGGHDADLD